MCVSKCVSVGVCARANDKNALPNYRSIAFNVAYTYMVRMGENCNISHLKHCQIFFLIGTEKEK